MKITAKIDIDIPIGMYCSKCNRVEHDGKGQHICSLFNRYIYIRRGNYLKCRECLNMLYDAIDKEG